MSHTRRKGSSTRRPTHTAGGRAVSSPVVHQHRNGAGDLPLHLAAKKGSDEIVKILVSNGADVNSRNDAGKTALFVAAENNKASIVKLLLAYNADVFLYDNTGRSPDDKVVTTNQQIITMIQGEKLHFCAAKGHNSAIRTLIKAGANIDFLNHKNRTPLYQAAKYAHADTCTTLLELGADVTKGESPIDIAATDQIRWTLLVGRDAYDSNQQSGEIATEGDHLVEAAELGNVEVVKHLLEDGLYVDCADSRGFTALHRAAYRGNVGVVNVLLEYGADTTIGSNLGGHCAVHYAAMRGHAEIVKLLIEHTS